MDNEMLLQQARDYVAQESDPFFKNQIESLIEKGDYNELNDRFYTELEFGTGGIRGVIGGGYNRMNPLVVRKATQGLANYIKKAGLSREPSVVIAYDSRHFSDLFALEAARVLCGNGIRTYVFTGLRPTPELSFAVRQLKATSGIVVTASHNPAEYNGYKVYWNDGAQVVAPHDKGIIQEVRAVKGRIGDMTKEQALQSGMLVMIDSQIDEPYIRMVKNLSLRPALVRERGPSFKVVYTPLHGTGAMPVSAALKEMGINVIFVPEQRDPDGNFPTVKFPNPEEESAMQLALRLGAKEEADLVIGTDPDADRVGIGAPDQGVLKLMTGNQLGVLLADYMFSSLKETGRLSPKSAFVKTIVTTGLQREIVESFGATCYDTLTGFKYIGELIRLFESMPDGPVYVMGGEESYGFLVTTEVRDKDAVSAATMTAEMALYHRSEGRTLWDQLRVLWKRYGYYEESVISKYFKGESGLLTMNNLMEKIRKNPPLLFAGQDVVQVMDYLDGTTWKVKENVRQKDIELPSSNVLQFILADKSVITTRPSGTEPKIKFYTSCCTEPGLEPGEAKAKVKKKIELITEMLNKMMIE